MHALSNRQIIQVLDSEDQVTYIDSIHDLLGLSGYTSAVNLRRLLYECIHICILNRLVFIALYFLQVLDFIKMVR